MGVDLDLKAASAGPAAREIGARVGGLLAARGDDDVYVSSFHRSALDAVRETDATIRRAYLFAAWPFDDSIVEEARRDGLWALHPDRACVTPQLLGDAHCAGLAVHAWTVNEPMARPAAAAPISRGVRGDLQ